jgi:hypothetical protein
MLNIYKNLPEKKNGLIHTIGEELSVRALIQIAGEHSTTVHDAVGVKLFFQPLK